MYLNNTHRVALGAALALVIGAVSAASPHFLRTNASINGSGDLTVSWKEAGLGNGGGLIDYEVTADVVARYQCVNRGGRCPAASNKQGVDTELSGVGEFPAGRNGQITGHVDVYAPVSTLNCPGQQVSQLYFLEWSNIVLEDVTNTVTAAVAPPDPITRSVCP